MDTDWSVSPTRDGDWTGFAAACLPLAPVALVWLPLLQRSLGEGLGKGQWRT